jgi:spore coat protein U-like protein
MKRIIAATAVAAALAAGGNAQAGQTTGQFNVIVTLTSSCTLGTVTNLDFAYTSLQAGAASATGGGFSVSCTNSLPYTFALQAGTTPPFNPPFATSIAVTDAILNLNYSVGLSATSGTGNGTPQAFNVTGTMAGGQAGTCATASCTNAGAGANRTHTLIVNY